MLLAAAGAIPATKADGEVTAVLANSTPMEPAPSWGCSCLIVRDPLHTVELRLTLLCRLNLRIRPLVSETNDTNEVYNRTNEVGNPVGVTIS